MFHIRRPRDARSRLLQDHKRSCSTPRFRSSSPPRTFLLSQYRRLVRLSGTGRAPLTRRPRSHHQRLSSRDRTGADQASRRSPRPTCGQDQAILVQHRRLSPASLPGTRRVVELDRAGASRVGHQSPHHRHRPVHSHPTSDFTPSRSFRKGRDADLDRATRDDALPTTSTRVTLGAHSLWSRLHGIGKGRGEGDPGFEPRARNHRYNAVAFDPSGLRGTSGRLPGLLVSF